MRYFVDCSYLGTEYVGWQRQPNGLSIQEVIENSVSTMLREDIAIVGCGRTDAGVHARNYIFHMDVETDLPEGFIRKINRFLPPDVAFNKIDPVTDDMHARYSAQKRSYEYYLSLGKDPFRQQVAYFYPYPARPDFDLMNAMGKMLLEYQDFSTFCKSGSDTPHFLCDVRHAQWQVNGDEATFRITANRFLRGMVRLIVGSMLRVGRGSLTLAEVRKALDTRTPLEKSDSAPAQGLHLVEITY